MAVLKNISAVYNNKYNIFKNRIDSCFVRAGYT